MPRKTVKKGTAKKVKTPASKAANPGSREQVSRATRTSHPIIAVGASAGGFEAFSKLLKALPPEPKLALIFIPHLDPTHESAMVELLSRSIKFPVLQAANGMRVAVNTLYVLPPNSDLTISKGILHLGKREAIRGQHMPIDTFFRSLAEDQTLNAVGVILSGTATDGTLGLSAIKNEGGITFAQDPQSAKYDGMPNSAISAGVVDFILPPEKIAQELLRIQPRTAAAAADPDPMQNAFDGKEGLMTEVFRLLKSVSKVDFADYKVATIRRRILRRMNINQIEELSSYVGLLRRNRKEIEALYRDVLINVTSFFRNAEVFESLREVVYPKLLEDRSTSDPIRVWVPGCSTGEETYSHAMSLVETLTDLRIEIPIQIFGTDLSEAAVQRARAGVYKESIVSDVSEVRLRRFFHKVTGGYQISKSIRDMCVFARQNVFSDPPFSRMDLISCRNVLIYLSPVLQKKIIPIFHYALKPNGFLLVGSTEGLVGAGSEIFDIIDRKSKIYQKKMVPSGVTFGMTVGVQEHAGASQEKAMHVMNDEEGSKTPYDVQREADRLLLTKYVPSAVVVTEDLDILQSRGHTNRYLELPPGKASLNLLKMARPGLLFELKALIDKARSEGVPASNDGILLENGDHTMVRLEVIPFRTPARQQQHFLVLFEDLRRGEVPAAAKTAPPRTPKEAKEVSDGKDQQIARLKQELAATKEYLQSIIESQEATNEELQSANEEIQSGNEELQSTNEELQTSKEELESANEELNTVNEEMQHRNQQLAQLNNDLINLLNSVTIPMVMLSDDLHIRRFTPEAEKVLGFSQHDLGKPLTHLKLEIDVPQLERWMLDVMRDVRMRSERVQSHNGTSYRMRITPYRTLDNKIEGVVLTLLDISELMPHNDRGAIQSEERG